jgi:hypothetical protein
MRTPTLIDVPQSCKSSRAKLTETKKLLGIETHRCAGLDEPWMAIHMPSARKFGYGVTETSDAIDWRRESRAAARRGWRLRLREVGARSGSSAARESQAMTETQTQLMAFLVKEYSNAVRLGWKNGSLSFGPGSTPADRAFIR